MSLDESIVTRIVVRRNQSLSPAGLAGFLVAGFILHLGVALAAGLAGWWPIVAFVGGSFIVLAGVVLSVMVAGTEREVITVSADTVTIEYGRRRPETCVRMQRYWARVERNGSPGGGLVLRSGGARAEFARALTSEECAALARRLAALIGPDGTETGNGDRALAHA